MKIISNESIVKKPLSAVIVYLARSTPEDIKNLRESLKLLHLYFNKRFNYPIIVFHEDFNEELKGEVSREIHSVIKFEKISFSTPEPIDMDDISGVGRMFPAGYRHMCRFFSGAIYKHSALSGYDWYWRLDTDSFILDEIRYDIFDYMDSNGFVYGYRSIEDEDDTLISGLEEETIKYIKKNNLPPFSSSHFIKDGRWNNKIYYTNFEISRFDFWRSTAYMKYFDYLDHLGGIYKNRWGDAPIHTLAVSMFIPEKATHMFDDLSYKHSSLYIPGTFMKKNFIFLRLKNSYIWKSIIFKKIYEASNILKIRFVWYKAVINFIKNVFRGKK